MLGADPAEGRVRRELEVPEALNEIGEVVLVEAPAFGERAHERSLAARLPGDHDEIEHAAPVRRIVGDGAGLRDEALRVLVVHRQVRGGARAPVLVLERSGAQSVAERPHDVVDGHPLGAADEGFTGISLHAGHRLVVHRREVREAALGRRAPFEAIERDARADVQRAGGHGEALVGVRVNEAPVADDDAPRAAERRRRAHLARLGREGPFVERRTEAGQHRRDRARGPRLAHVRAEDRPLRDRSRPDRLPRSREDARAQIRGHKAEDVPRDRRRRLPREARLTDAIALEVHPHRHADERALRAGLVGKTADRRRHVATESASRTITALRRARRTPLGLGRRAPRDARALRAARRFGFEQRCSASCRSAARDAARGAVREPLEGGAREAASCAPRQRHRPEARSTSAPPPPARSALWRRGLPGFIAANSDRGTSSTCPGLRPTSCPSSGTGTSASTSARGGSRALGSCCGRRP